MVTVFDVEASKLIPVLKEELKKFDTIRPAEWSKFSKSGVTRGKPPTQEDFWYIRAAAVLRQVYKVGKPLGVQRLRTKYGGKEQDKSGPSRFRKGSGKVIRKILQQLEESGFVKKTVIDGKKGRVITPKGKSLVDKAAAKIKKESGNASKE